MEMSIFGAETKMPATLPMLKIAHNREVPILRKYFSLEQIASNLK